MLPKTLNEWIQHYGRAGRNGQPAIAILLVEPSAFNLRKIKIKKDNPNKSTCTKSRGKRRIPIDDTVDSTELDEEDHEINEADEPIDNICDESKIEGQPAYQKQVEDGLRKWLDAILCQRVIQDEYFKNPPASCRMFILCNNRVILTVCHLELNVPCCDLCLMQNTAQNIPWVRTERKDKIIDLLMRLNIQKSRCDTADSDNQTMPIVKKKKAGKGARRGERFQSCHEALSDWRRWRWRTTYRRCIWGMEVLLPDKVLDILAKAAHIKTVDNIRRDLPEWEWVNDYGAEVLDRLRPIDNQWKAESTHAAEENKAKRRRTSEENKALRDDARHNQKHLDTLRKRAIHAVESTPGPSRHPLSSTTAPPQPTALQWAPSHSYLYHSTPEGSRAMITLPSLFHWMPLEDPGHNNNM